MIQVTHICHNGHFIYGGGNVQFCRNGTSCYHKIRKGRYAHEYKADSYDDFCKFCQDKHLDANLHRYI